MKSLTTLGIPHVLDSPQALYIAITFMRIIMKADKESGMFMKIYFDMDSFDYPQELRNNWNKRLRSMRIIALLLSILMMILGVVCFLYPVKTMGVLEKSAAFLILVAGVYEIINYFKTPVYFRQAFELFTGICNILLGCLLLFSPASFGLSTFSWLFAMISFITGIGLLHFSSQLRFFGIIGTSWMVVDGILAILLALLLIMMPMAGPLMISYLLACYLCIGGIILLIETINLKDLKI